MTAARETEYSLRLPRRPREGDGQTHGRSPGHLRGGKPGTLAALERGLLELEKRGSGADEALVHGIFRDAHSIKAGANLLGLSNIETLAHKMENILEKIRRAEIVPTERIVSILLEGLDTVKDLVDNVEDSQSRDISRILERLLRVAGLRGA